MDKHKELKKQLEGLEQTHKGKEALGKWMDKREKERKVKMSSVTIDEDSDKEEQMLTKKMASEHSIAVQNKNQSERFQLNNMLKKETPDKETKRVGQPQAGSVSQTHAGMKITSSVNLTLTGCGTAMLVQLSEDRIKYCQGAAQNWLKLAKNGCEMRKTFPLFRCQAGNVTGDAHGEKVSL